MSDTLTIPWPGAPLSETRWRDQLTELATKAEALIGRNCSLQDTAELALQLVGLLWPALGEASTVAATCRASLVMGAPGVIVSSSPGDQWAAIHNQLDQVFEQAQASPAASVVTLPQPMLCDVRPDVAPRKPRQPRQPKTAELDPDADPAGVIELEPAPASPAADPDDLPEAWMDCAELAQHPVEALEVIEPEPLPVVITPLPPGPAPARQLRPRAERLAPRPAEPAPATEPSPGWFSAEEVAELLEVEPCSVDRWRRDGLLGDEGTGWQQCGQTYYFDPGVVENIDGTQIPGGLDQLVAEVQAP